MFDDMLFVYDYDIMKHYLGHGPQDNLYDATAYYRCDGSIFS